MSCGCASRMRKYVLPFFGYELNDGMWLRPGMQGIPDTEVADHYSRLTAQIVAEFGARKLKELFHQK